MKCPKCGKELEIKMLLETVAQNETCRLIRVVGSCEDCSYDGSFLRFEPLVGETVELDLHQYFHG